MALIWLAPAWVVFDRDRTAATFVGLGFWFGMLPDADLVLSNWFVTVKHHGVLHTVLAVTIAAAVIGPIVGWLLKRTLGDTQWFSRQAADGAYGVGFVMIWVAGLSHLFGDMLSAPDIAEAIEPLWPIYGQSIGIDLVWYNSTWVNWGLFLAGVALNVALFLWLRRSAGARDRTPA